MTTMNDTGPINPARSPLSAVAEGMPPERCSEIRKPGLAIVLFALFAGLCGALPAQANGPDTQVLTTAKPLYAAQCASCHGAALEGGQFGPPLKGPAFATRWGARGGELLGIVRASMPPGAAGALTDTEYRALVDLLLAANGQKHADPPVAQNQRLGLETADVGPRPPPESAFHDVYFRQERARRELLLARLTPVTAAMLRSPPAADWLSWRLSQDASGYSPLRQIDRSNVSGLRLKWAWTLGQGRNEIAPIVHDGVMFVNSAYDVEALDAATGTLLWRYSRDIAPAFRGPLNMVQRNMAIDGRLLVVPTADRHLVALDVGSGKVVWDTEIVPASVPGVVLSSGPVVAGDVLVQGTSIGSMCNGGCYVVGVDAASGRVLWRFVNIAGPGSPGDDSWNGTPDGERTGGAVWSAPSFDPDLDLVFFGTGGTYNISRLLRPGPPGTNGDALYTDSTLALDAKTGRLRWFHQHLPRDVWDLDEAFERSLVTVAENGQQRRLVVTIGKVGILDALDRDTGHYQFSLDLGLNNIVRAIDPKTGRRTIDAAKVPIANRPVEICPSVQGARNWMATAFDPVSNTLFVPLQELCMDFVWSEVPASDDRKVDMAWTLKRAPGSNGNYGRIQAIDLTTRKIKWLTPSRTVPSSSLLATGGGLVFSGTADRDFRALDDRTGRVVWETRLAAPPNATPVTFSVAGHQYVAVASGASGDQATQTAQLTPEEAAPSPATTIWVFGL